MLTKIRENEEIICLMSKEFANNIERILIKNREREMPVLKGYLTCEVVAKLVPYYIDDKLDGFQRDCVAIHLRNCPTCMNKYSTIKKFLDDVRSRHKEELENKRLSEGLSVHYDGECSKSELLSVEAAFCNSNVATEKYEQIANLSKLMANSFMQTKEQIVFDCSKTVLEKCKKRNLLEKFIDLFEL